MRDEQHETATQARLRVCGNKPGASSESCLGRDWYQACLECLADLDHHAEHHGNLPEAFAPWCELCAAVAEALNADEGPSSADHVEYLNGTPIARWLLRRLDRRLW